MRIAVGIEYNGTHYHGWQNQLDGNSVQEQVERALSKVADHPVTVLCAGRTDKAVHATGQVVHFDTESIRKEHSWILGANSHLAPDIRLLWVRPVQDTFHARFSAQYREYRYIIHNTKYPSALMAHQVTWIPYVLHVEPMQEACAFFLGKQDFTSIRGAHCQAKHPIRTIQEITIRREGELIVLAIRADGFLHHMVRNIMGILLEIGCLRENPTWVQEVLAAQKRTAAGMTAPPTGLYLVRVGYPEEYNIPQGKLPLMIRE